MNERWKRKNKPASFEARFDFNDFETLRVFLDEIADQAELLDHYPNISFTRARVSVVISAKSEELGELEPNLAQGIDDSYSKVVDFSQGASV